MSLLMTVRAWRRSVSFAGAMALLAGAIFIGFGDRGVEASAVAGTGTTFPANAGTLGSIPDGPVGGAVCGDFGAPRNVTFTVSGVSAPLSDVAVSVTGTHTWVGDLEITLIAPDGTSTANLLKQVGAATATACGDDSDFAGPYVFSDTAPASPTFWQAATTATGAVPVAAGSYRSSAPLTGANTLITPVFAGVTDPNGTWTLRVRDGGEGDTGSITAASLTLTGAAGPTGGDGPLDYDGDGKTDYTVVRNIGGGSEGQSRWFIQPSAGGATIGSDWGLASDFFISGDFDGDDKDDIAVWRPGTAGTAAFYILNSATNTARVEAFGQTGDNPAVVGDYNGDGTTDIAVYREGLNPGDQSVFYYRTAPEGATTFIPWGQNGDFVAAGDYDGDGKHDFAIQRADGGSGFFWILRSSDFGSSVVQFGLPSDLTVPGDYDGDGKTDVAVARAAGGSYTWYYLSSETGSAFQVEWGLSATDFAVPGDYDGDGRTDFAVWRDGNFWVLNSETFATSVFGLGSAGDYPVANYIVQ